MRISIRRNPAEKVRAMVDDMMSRYDTYIPSALASELVQKLRDEDPQLLREWLDYHAEDLIRDMINEINRGRRSTVVKRSSRSVFKSAIERAEAGEPALLEGWLSQDYTIDVHNTRKQLGHMYREEVLHAAGIHRQLSRGNAMQAAFLEAIAAKIGARQVCDVFDNDQLEAQWRSIS